MRQLLKITNTIKSAKNTAGYLYNYMRYSKGMYLCNKCVMALREYYKFML